MLTLARDARGLTQTELADKVGVTQSRISKLEDGLSPSPPEEIVSRLVAELKFPRHFFFQPGAARAACESFYRKRSSLPVSILKCCDARMNVKRMHIERLAKAAEFDTLNLPFLDPDEIEGGAAQIARQIRAHWKIPRGPIKNLVKIVEDAGIVVVWFDFGSAKLDGVSLFGDDGTPIIFLNKNLPPDRMRLTLAHELGHIIMHRVPKADMEDEAFEFAGEFLMPETEIRSSFYPLNVDQLARLKLYWRVSMAALLSRAEKMGAVTERYARYLWMQMGKFGYKTIEPHQNQIALEPPMLLRELVALHTGELEYTKAEMAHALAMTVEEFEEQYGSPTPPKLQALT